MASGSIFNIQRFSLHDGDGLRTTVFLKGCPLRCGWCHNPESQERGPERVHHAERCIHCGRCAAACRTGALRMTDSGPAVAGSCTLAGACAAACPTGATEILGRAWSVDEVMAAVRKDVAFFDESGGGVTFSGGEPLLQPDFLEALLLACRAEGIRTAIDTCGHADPEDVERTIPLADAVLYDVKHVDEEMHRAGTGVTNRTILDNLLRVRRLSADAGAALVIRVPLIAGYNDSDEDAERLAGRIAALHPSPPVDLLPCHRFGSAKYVRLGRTRSDGWCAPTPERIDAFVAVLASAGLEVTVRGEREPQCH